MSYDPLGLLLIGLMSLALVLVVVGSIWSSK